MAEETNGLTLGLVEDRRYRFAILNIPKTEAVDITGWELSWMLKRRLSDANALLEKTTTSGITIGGTYAADPSVNTQRALVSIAHADTETLRPGNYRFELKRMDSTAKTTLALGTLELVARVHRA